MIIIVLNSGSNGNAVYVESETSGAAVLLDCGISRRKIEQRLKVHGRFADNIRAVFITHEHGDHVEGLPVFSKCYHVPVYLTELTYRYHWKRQQLKGFRFIGNRERVTVDDLAVEAFPKLHDAADPVGFVVHADGKSFLYATDLGAQNAQLTALLPTVDALMLESNHDTGMLWQGDYPPELKRRVASDRGHLSNTQAMTLIRSHCDGRLQALILGHLSEKNNTTAIVRDEIAALHAMHPHRISTIQIASRCTVGEIVRV